MAWITSWPLLLAVASSSNLCYGRIEMDRLQTKFLVDDLVVIKTDPHCCHCHALLVTSYSNMRISAYMEMRLTNLISVVVKTVRT